MPQSANSSGGGPELGSVRAFGLEGIEPADSKQLAEAAERILKDPLALKDLSDRVYRLMQEDIRRQRERLNGSGRSRHAK